MSTKATVSIDVDAKSGGGAWGRISRELTSALEEPLLRPLIDIVFQYARSTADWSRATLETLPMARHSATTTAYPCAVSVDTAGRRLLWTEFNTDPLGGMLAVSFDDVKAVLSDSAAAAAADSVTKSRTPLPATAVKTVAGPLLDLTPAPAPSLERCLRTPAPIAIERPPAAEGKGSAGGDALWVACESPNRVVRVDERTRTIIVFGGSPAGGMTEGAPDVALFRFPVCVVWDAANNRALVSDSQNNRIRAITRDDKPKGAGWTVSTLIGSGKAGTVDGSLSSAELALPTAMVFDLWRPPILYITSSNSTYLRVADLQAGPSVAMRCTWTLSVLCLSADAVLVSCGWLSPSVLVAALAAPAGTVRTVKFVAPPDQRSTISSYGVVIDPLSTEDAPVLLMTCYSAHALYRLSVTDGALTLVMGPGRGILISADEKRLSAPNGLALAPRELLHDSDALALVVCDLSNGRLRIVRVPY
jgi:hypothetical protein